MTILANYFFSSFINNMKIQNNNINFKQKYPTGKILEITSLKIFEPDGVSGYINTLKEIHGNVPRYVGSQGYKRYAEEISAKIVEKYPEIGIAAKEIIDIASKHTYIRSAELKTKIQHILERFEKEIDIVI